MEVAKAEWDDGEEYHHVTRELVGLGIPATPQRRHMGDAACVWLSADAARQEQAAMTSLAHGHVRPLDLGWALKANKEILSLPH